MLFADIPPGGSINESSFNVVDVLTESFVFPGQKAGIADIARICEVAIRNRNSCRYMNI